MNKTSFLGLILAMVALVSAFLLEGGKVTALIQVTAALIVFGGTVAVILISTPSSLTRKIPLLLKIALFDRKFDYQSTIDTLYRFAEMSRKEGILSLEKELSKEHSPFMKRGLTMLVDGMSDKDIRDVLDLELSYTEKRHARGSSVFSNAGTFAPALGITGTVMGLVQVLSHMDDPSTLGHSISVAFIATLYGVASANILWLPISIKLKALSKEEILQNEIILEGIASIASGQTPKLISEKLQSFLPPEERIQRKG